MKLNKTLIIFTALFFILGVVKIFSQPVQNENSIKFENVTTATLVGQDGLIMRTENSGIIWTEQTSGITNVLNSNDYISYINIGEETVKMQLAVGENGIILKSIDDGTTWNLMPSGTTEILNDVKIYSANLIYVCGNNGTFLSSNDYGETWNQVTINTTKNLNEIAVSNPQTAVANIKAVVVGDSGTVFGSVIMEDWFELTSPTTENLITATFMDNTVICGGDNGTIIKSIDNGLNWITSASGITTKIYDIKFVNITTVMGASENGVMVRSEDAGDNWTVITTPATVDLFAVNFGSESFGISTGAEGTEIYTTDGGATWVISMNTIATLNNSGKDPVSLNQNYPNPFNPSTVISYNVTGNSNVSIKVYDLTGKEVRTLVNSFQNAGTYSVNFNATNLASGIYFYVLRVNTGTNDITKTMRMILTK